MATPASPGSASLAVRSWPVFAVGFPITGSGHTRTDTRWDWGMLLLSLFLPLAVLLALLGMERVERWVTDGTAATTRVDADVAGQEDASPSRG